MSRISVPRRHAPLSHGLADGSRPCLGIVIRKQGEGSRLARPMALLAMLPNQSCSVLTIADSCPAGLSDFRKRAGDKTARRLCHGPGHFAAGQHGLDCFLQIMPRGLGTLDTFVIAIVNAPTIAHGARLVQYEGNRRSVGGETIGYFG